LLVDIAPAQRNEHNPQITGAQKQK